MAEVLSTMGSDVWVCKYRRVGDAGGGWAGSLEDIIAAVEFVTDETGQAHPRRPLGRWAPSLTRHPDGFDGWRLAVWLA